MNDKIAMIRKIRTALRAWSDRALARLALSNQARHVSDDARDLVKPRPDEDVRELLERASQLHQNSEEVLQRAAIYAAESGVSWTDIGEALDITRQAAAARYSPLKEEWRDALIEPVIRDNRSMTHPRFADWALTAPHDLAKSLNTWIFGPQERDQPESRQLQDTDIATALPPITPTTHTLEVLWRADAITKMRSVDGEIPEDLREDYEIRKATALNKHTEE